MWENFCSGFKEFCSKIPRKFLPYSVKEMLKELLILMVSTQLIRQHQRKYNGKLVGGIVSVIIPFDSTEGDAHVANGHRSGGRF